MQTNVIHMERTIGQTRITVIVAEEKIPDPNGRPLPISFSPPLTVPWHEVASAATDSIETLLKRISVANGQGPDFGRP